MNPLVLSNTETTMRLPEWSETRSHRQSAALKSVNHTYEMPNSLQSS